MSARSIPRHQWASFFDSFSHAHEGWLSTIVVAREGSQPMIEACDMRTNFATQSRTGKAVQRDGTHSGGGSNAPSGLYPCAPGGPNDYIWIMGFHSEQRLSSAIICRNVR